MLKHRNQENKKSRKQEIKKTLKHRKHKIKKSRKQESKPVSYQIRLFLNKEGGSPEG